MAPSYSPALAIALLRGDKTSVRAAWWIETVWVYRYYVLTGLAIAAVRGTPPLSMATKLIPWQFRQQNMGWLHACQTIDSATPVLSPSGIRRAPPYVLWSPVTFTRGRQCLPSGSSPSNQVPSRIPAHLGPMLGTIRQNRPTVRSGRQQPASVSLTTDLQGLGATLTGVVKPQA